ncbi:MAG: thioredoxin family protein [Sulfurimonadaceae bacterium]
MRKIVVMFLMLSSMLFASPINWAKDYKSGVAEATKQTKPILFISSRHTCKYCVILEKTALMDPKIVNELNRNFISVVSYSDEGDYLPKELWRPGTPAIWFLDDKGEPLFQPIMGAVDAENFYRALTLVKEEYIKRLKTEARSK